MASKKNSGDGQLDAVEQQLDKAEELLTRAEQLEQRADEIESRFKSNEAPVVTTVARPTDITIVLDRSGSMESTKSDAIGGFNNFLAEQRKLPGRTAVTLVQFDDQYEPVYEGRPLDDAPELTDKTFVPRGGTALLDAIGQTIVRTDQRFAKQDNPAELVIFVIITDGQENSSVEYDRAKVFKMIRSHEKEHNWKFIFMGTNQDAIAEAGAMGIMGQHAMTYGAKHFRSSSDVLARKMMAYRSSGNTEDLAFTPEDRQEANPEE